MRIPMLCLVLAGVAACTPRVNANPDTGAVDVDMEPVTQSGEVWQADLAARGGSGVTGSARATVRGEETRVTVSIRGAQPDASHPWHIHEGTCETGGGVVGGGAPYPPLAVASNGQAQADAVVMVPLNEARSYHINVHNSRTDMGNIVACGDLDD